MSSLKIPNEWSQTKGLEIEYQPIVFNEIKTKDEHETYGPSRQIPN